MDLTGGGWQKKDEWTVDILYTVRIINSM